MISDCFLVVAAVAVIIILCICQMVLGIRWIRKRWYPHIYIMKITETFELFVCVQRHLAKDALCCKIKSAIIKAIIRH